MRARLAAARYAPPLTAGIVFLAGWEYVPRLLGISRLLIPSPLAVARSAWLIFERGLLVDNFLITLVEALSGFVAGSLAATLCAILITRSRLIETALMPYLVGFQALPKVALAPLIVVWFGIGIESKIFIAAVISFFPVLVNAIIGFSTIEREKLELMQSLVASPWQEFRIVVFPNSLPFIFAGLNVAIVLSITGALVGEFIGADRGLGNLLMQLNFNMDTSGMFAVLILLALLGITLHGTVRVLHRRLVFWAEPDRVTRDGS